MDLKEIRQLIKMVESSAISEIEIEEKDKKVKISKNVSGQAQFQQMVPAAPALAASAAAPAPQTEASPATQSKRPDNVYEVKSPMVGTFYRSASPDSDPYVDIGKAVKTGDVLCIVEAMKLMNEIETEVSGKILQILVDNAQPVEFNQVLFLIEKA